MKISDELREIADKFYTTTEKLRYLADRIDSEMVELPRDNDGVPIHVGDLVYLGDERKAIVTEIDTKDSGVVIDCWDGIIHVEYHPADITRNLPDSWDRIADELEKWCDSADVDGDACGKPRDLAGRILRLAKKESQR